MYKKVFLSPVYISFHIFDRVFLLETYLSSETSSDEDNLDIPRYNIVKNHHPSNTKRRGQQVSKYLFTNEKKLQLNN